MYISSLFLAYVDSNPPINTGSSSPSNNLMLTSFTIENGLPQIGEFSFGDPVPVTGGQSSKAAPAFFTESYVNNPVPPSSPLFLAYVANDPSNHLLVTTSTDYGKTWLTPWIVTGPQSSKFSPSSTQLTGNLTTTTTMLAYVANSDANHLLVTTSSDNCKSWATPLRVMDPQTGKQQSSKMAPALIQLTPTDGQARLVLVYVANSDANHLLVTTSTDFGVHWTTPEPVKDPHTGLAQSSKTPPVLLTGLDYPFTLALAYVANSDDNHLLVTTSTSVTGATWTTPVKVMGPSSTPQSSTPGPALCAFGDLLVLAYVETGPPPTPPFSSGVVFTTQSYYNAGEGWSPQFAFNGLVQSTTTPALLVGFNSAGT